MSFEYTSPNWQAGGVEPTDGLKQQGFKAGDKPPATYFNWLFSRISACITELQNISTNLDERTNMMNGNDNKLSDYGIIDAYTKSACKNIFGLVDSFVFDENYIPLLASSSASIMTSTFQSEKSRIKYIFISSKVSIIQCYAFSGFVKLTDVYINNKKNNITIESGAIPPTAKVHYVDDFNAVDFIMQALMRIVGAKYSESGGEIFNDYVYNVASGSYSHAEGQYTTASGWGSHAEGCETIASGECSHAEGCETIASGECSHAEGLGTIANDFQFVTGIYNKDTTAPKDVGDTTGSIFVVGCGTYDYQANALRISAAGQCYGTTAFAAGGADYAEYFEWVDSNTNNEDRRGLFVTLDGEKIRLANSTDEYILGVVSSTPAVCGDIQSENWKDMYLKDVFGNRLTEIVNVPESVDEKTGQTIPAHTETQFIINPEYDPTRDYISREDRKEWAAIGFIGKLVVVDDGTCQPNGYCKVADGGIVTNSTEKTTYRVLSRLDDNHIKILLK